MQGVIAGQESGFNPKVLTPSMMVAATSSTTNVTIVNVSGSGYLTSLCQGMRNTDTSQALYSYVTVTIDGTVVLNDAAITFAGEHGGFTSSASKAHVNSNTFYGLFKFNTSLVIAHRSGSAASACYTYVGYLLN